MLQPCPDFAPYFNNSSGSAYAADQQRFDKFEIRVIRQKFFSKKKRLELGAQGLVIMNQTFVYTYMASGLLAFHFTEEFGLEANGAYGFSSDKQDKKTLNSTYKIKTVVLRTEYQFEGALLWTPVYGKYQLASGRLIYFDTFLAAGAGMTGVRYKYDHCPTWDELSPDAQAVQSDWKDPPAPAIKTYPSWMLGLGQRFFLDRNSSIKWDIRYRGFRPSAIARNCNPEAGAEEGGSEIQHNVFVQLGASRFL